VPNPLLRFTPAGQAVAKFDRARIALVLNAQAFVGVVAGIQPASGVRASPLPAAFFTPWGEG
jgi:hypothetical protein